MVGKWQQIQLCYGYHRDCYKHCGQSQALLSLRQQASLQKLLTIVTQSIPFYQKFASVDFQQFPIVNKTLLQENFPLFNKYRWTTHQALQTKHSALTARISAGSSGEPGIYLSSSDETIHAITDLLSKMLRWFSWWQHPKIAYIHFTPGNYFPATELASAVQWLNINLREGLPILLKKLSDFQPEILIAPAHVLYHLATLQDQQQIRLNIKKVISTAEVLTPIEEAFITQIFQLPVHQLYQCAEGTLGVTCKYGTLHLNEDLFLIEKEWLDLEQKRFIPVITALTHYTQPLIRYRMEDILLVKPACPCQSPLMAVEKVLGRCQDTLYLRARHEAHVFKPVYFDAIYQMMSQVAGGVHNYQFIQYSPQHIAIKMQAKNVQVATRSLLAQLQSLCQGAGIVMPQVTFAPLEKTALDQVFRHIKRVNEITSVAKQA